MMSIFLFLCVLFILFASTLGFRDISYARQIASNGKS
jgi:hypothetical protein